MLIPYCLEILEELRRWEVKLYVASDEAGRSGKPDAWKRDRLIGVGADLVIPDWRPLLDYLWTES